jgi:hypothetical protein
MRPLTEAAIESAIVERCRESEARARVATRAIVDALMQACPPQVLARFGALARPPRSRRVIATLDELVADVAVTVDASPAVALEEIEVACAAIADAWSDDDLRSVRSTLPHELASLFARSEVAEATGPRARPKQRRTLSSGRPGVEHPIASSPPDDGAHTLATGHPKAFGR